MEKGLGARISTRSDAPAARPLGESKISRHSRVMKIEEAPFQSAPRVRIRRAALGGRASLIFHRWPTLCSSHSSSSTGQDKNPSAQFQQRGPGAIRVLYQTNKREGSCSKSIAGTTKNQSKKVKLASMMPANIKRNRRPCFTQVKWGVRKVTWVLPYNNRFNPPDLGRHVVCLRKRRAGAFGSLLLRRRDHSPSPAG